MPRVSVIIPAYNPGRVLRRAVESVLAQTFTDFEVLVIDDGGAEDVSWVSEEDSRIRLVSQQNRGVSVARNVGAICARGELVAYLDQDDEWLPSKLAEQVAVYDGAASPPVVHTEFIWMLRDGSEELGQHATPVTYYGLLSDQHVCLSSVLVGRDAVIAAGGFSPLLRYMQDYDLFLRLGLESKFACVRQPLVRYYLHEENVSLDFRTGVAERNEILAAHDRLARHRNDDQARVAVKKGRKRTNELFGGQAFDSARQNLRAGHQAGLKDLALALRWNPGFTMRSLMSSGVTAARNQGLLTRRSAGDHAGD